MPDVNSRSGCCTSLLYTRDDAGITDNHVNADLTAPAPRVLTPTVDAETCTPAVRYACGHCYHERQLSPCRSSSRVKGVPSSKEQTYGTSHSLSWVRTA
ncbi:hypothetical protein GCM10010390_07110 [Streptomyces mordarskii]|uniref:Uncharacterized protein n=1 Tax=Streptomyces mordarskii TaxID=1226758 RepID=A0ABN1BW11_9ACTN